MSGKLDRREFLKRAGLGTAALILSSDQAMMAVQNDGARKTARKPNIVIILADDQSQIDSGCYGNTVVQTPNIDRLASEGMRFTRAFTGTAMCTPSRSMMYTGLYPHRNGAHPNHSSVREGTKSIAYYLKAQGYRVGLVGKRHFKPEEAFPFEFYLRAAENAGKFIADAKGGPFCLVIATHRSHAPWPAQSPYDPAAVQLPPYLIDTPETRKAVANYYADVHDLDTEVGECLAEIDKHGLKEDSLVIYTSDHGACFPHAKWNLYEASLKVPFIVRWPGHIKAGSVSDAMIHFVDVVSTCVELAGGKAIAALDGRSFLPVLLGKTQKHHEVVYGASTGDGKMNQYPMRCLRTETHKLIWNLRHEQQWTTHITFNRTANPPEVHCGYWESWTEKAKTDPAAARRLQADLHRPELELYDLRVNPNELNNIAGDPSSASLVASLRKRLEAWMQSQADRGASQ